VSEHEVVVALVLRIDADKPVVHAFFIKGGNHITPLLVAAYVSRKGSDQPKPRKSNGSVRCVADSRYNLMVIERYLCTERHDKPLALFILVDMGLRLKQLNKIISDNVTNAHDIRSLWHRYSSRPVPFILLISTTSEWLVLLLAYCIGSRFANSLR